MARDLVSGGLFFITGSCLAYFLASVLPLWWFTTTELEGQMCSCGTGLWTGNVTWGNALTQPQLKSGPINCSIDSPLMLAGCDANRDGQAETRTKGYVSGVFSIIATLFALVSFGFGFSVLCSHRGPMDVIKFRKGLCWAALASIVSVFCEIITISVFMSTPLFSNLGRDFGCKFEFKDAINSNPLKCHALGPSFGLAVGGCILSTFACTMFYLAFKNPTYMDPETGRYSMYQEQLLGARPLDAVNAKMRLVDGDDEEEDDEDEFQDDAQGNLVPVKRERSVSAYLRHAARLYGVPVLLMLNAALFVWSNCSTGATVEPNVAIKLAKPLPWWLRPMAKKYLPQLDKNGTIAFKDDVFNFTLITSLRHFWEGKAYALAFLIGGFSGCWPYIKIFTMMFLWFVPATEKLRGKMLHWLDVLGKWSLIDAYVLCLMAVAFGFNTDKSVKGEIDIHVDISVRPGWGVYSFVLATMWSLSLSHYATYLHRNAIDRREISPALEKAMQTSIQESLASRAYAPFPKRRRYTCSKFGQILLWFILLATLTVTLCGQLFYTFEFRFSGLADLILPPEKRTTAYSLVTNGLLLPEAAAKGGYLSGGGWAWFMTIMYFLFAMCVPLVMLVLLAALWGMPMTLASTKRMFYVCETVQAWAALDVFLVSIMAAVLEIGGLSQAVIGDAFGSQEAEVCKFLKSAQLHHPKILDKLLKWLDFPPLGPELENCALFRVDAILMEGCWMLLCGIIAWGVCTHMIMEFAEASIHERTTVLVAIENSKNGEDNEATTDDMNDPYARLRMHEEEDNVSESSGSDIDEATEAAEQNNNHLEQPLISDTQTSERNFDLTTARTQSRQIRKILIAQEQGAKRFMGAYFGDCMYGPFPREWWRWFDKVNILNRVPWERIGAELQALLIANGLSPN